MLCQCGDQDTVGKAASGKGSAFSGLTKNAIDSLGNGVLADFLGQNDIGLPVLYSEYLTGDGQEMFEHAAN
jgi:hypothetical protein